MSCGNCCKYICPIILGIFSIVVGLILTLVGHFAKPFWSEEDSWCSFCKKDRERTLENLENCRKAGPVFIGVGIVLTVVFCIRRHRHKAQEPKQGGAVISYTSTGTIPANQQTYGAQTTSGYQPVSLNTGYNQPTYGYAQGVPPQPPAGYAPGITTTISQQPYGPPQPSLLAQGGAVYPQTTTHGYQDLPPPPAYSAIAGQPTVDQAARPPPFNPAAPPGY